jgi:UDP-N-acetylmuramoyl-L-alanyl-D-glutamate--2,6-diaminopimelate ligase
VEAARKKGASAIASEHRPSPGNALAAGAGRARGPGPLSAAVLGEPGKALELVGVTGTNGKTTTTYLIDAALRAAGHKVGLLGTVQYRIGDRLADATRTTPEASDLQALLREMVDAGLLARRARGLVALARAQARAGLRVPRRRLHEPHPRPSRLPRRHGFVLPGQAEAVRGARAAGRTVRDQRGRRPRGRAHRRLARPVWTYGIDKPADFRAEDVRLALDGTRFRVESPLGTHEVRSALVGRFNVQNVLAAFAAAAAAGVEPDVALRGLATVMGVPGRLERVAGATGFAVIVDYATPTTRSRTCWRRSASSGPAASSPSSAAAATAIARNGRSWARWPHD